MAQATEPTPQQDNSYRVMICVDDSHNAELAFQYYADHIHRAENAVVLTHVSEFYYPSAHLYSGGMGIAMAMPIGYAPDVAEEALKNARNHHKHVQNMYHRKCQNLGIKHEFLSLVEDGHGLGHVICDAVHKHTIHLVILGSRGRGTLRRTILGSVSDYVLHHSHVPTIICPKQAFDHGKEEASHHQQQK